MHDPRIKLYRKYWYIVYRDGEQTKRVSLRTKDRGEAERNYAEFIKSVEIKGETVGQIITAYLQDRKDMASHSIASMIARKHLQPRFGNLMPNQITRSNTRDYTAFRRKAGAKDWTIRRELGILRTSLLWADKRSPAIVEMPPEGMPRERYLRKDEFRALLSKADAPHVRTFLLLALATGGRMSAVLELTWDRIDFEHGLIKLATGNHGNKGRATVPMNEMIRKELELSYKARTSDHAVEYGGRPVKSVKKGVAAAAERAKLEGVTPNVLRHTAAVWMAIDGVPIEKIARFLGHTNPKITFKHYAKYSPTYLADAASSLAF